MSDTKKEWPLWEVFIRGQHGMSHRHVGSLHAADEEMAILNARDVYTRRNEGVSIWVVEAKNITASSPDQKGPMYEPSNSKVYRHPTFFDIPDDVGAM
ncbi:1,2-phenylacetyl-CoA epoxidase subunit PaaB [Amylibacter sp. IMCC11727]|uniref:1,2-phenylacetyl-CoA epoxidase subunit PaaB n=1 Tax=Amylibacter sp. IMCC11727 TaxID=3039851 RepID=UPI00244E1113|nr:1,2-phenylacetyl-CoA epoxidase subunit PaaB [Amylibacter sp. IMCC11727]WGI22088.1 1,2-phenylacetyl-CoA epoxidase subunit B [Amylibacter sp. IMCC11727]